MYCSKEHTIYFSIELMCSHHEMILISKQWGIVEKHDARFFFFRRRSQCPF